MPSWFLSDGQVESGQSCILVSSFRSRCTIDFLNVAELFFEEAEVGCIGVIGQHRPCLHSESRLHLANTTSRPNKYHYYRSVHHSTLTDFLVVGMHWCSVHHTTRGHRLF